MGRLLAAVTVLAAAASAVGCMGGDAGVEASAAQRLVLQQEDVPRVFDRFDFGRMAQADLRGASDRHGRELGWKARYRRPGTSDTAGPLVIESLLDVFGSASGADEELEDVRADVERPEEPVVTPTSQLDPPDLGDEAVAWSALVPAQPRNTIFFTIVWRHENAVATLAVNGFEGRLGLGDAVALARKQQARLEAGG